MHGFYRIDKGLNVDKQTTNENSLILARVVLLTTAIGSILGCATVANEGKSTVPPPLTTNMNSELTFYETPLTADKAVQLALVNNQNLAAVYAELGFAKAEVFAGSRIRNPLLSFSRLNSNTGLDQIVWGISASLTDLITLRSRKKLATAEALAIEEKVQAYVADVQALTYQHYYQYLASKQRLQVAQEISTISKLILETTQRYSDAGNVTALKLAEAKIGASEAKLELLQTQAANLMARTKMSETLGIRASQSWHLPDQLPLPDIANREANEDLDKAIQQALKQRPDLKAARSKIAALRLRLKSHNLENTTGDIELGAERERETGGERLTGPIIEWEVPVFSRGQAEQLRIRAELEVARAELKQLTLELTNSIYLALAGRENSANKIMQYQNHLLPAHTNAVARTQEEQFFMLIGVFEVLQSKKRQYQAFLGYIDAVEEYWLTNTALAKSMGISPKAFMDQANQKRLSLLQTNAGEQNYRRQNKPKHGAEHRHGHDTQPMPAASAPTHPAGDHSSHTAHKQPTDK